MFIMLNGAIITKSEFWASGFIETFFLVRNSTCNNLSQKFYVPIASFHKVVELELQLGEAAGG